MARGLPSLFHGSSAALLCLILVLRPTGLSTGKTGVVILMLWLQEILGSNDREASTLLSAPTAREEKSLATMMEPPSLPELPGAVHILIL